MIGIPVGLLAANAFEWVVHRYVLHGLGRRKQSFWAFHWHEHHGASRRGGMHDEHYERAPLGWHAQGKELLGLTGVAVAVSALWPVAPFFVMTAYYSAFNYYRVHKRSHQDPEWARQHLPWHYDHHMGPDQHKNWCVTRPWFDQLMGTREPYVGTEREAADRARAEARRARRSAAPSAAAAQATAEPTATAGA
ncbi:MAG: hypothetical protein KIT72_12815 [Polyangiaceae bacterium]|nr:hypothetical protein [Polyangiaceae bacterium]MCW5791294.1 hypothetical protein [Polyangiaceae bacterium]